MAPACTFFANQPSDAQAPFEFKSENGTVIDPVLDTGSGLCYYPGAHTCKASSYVDTLSSHAWLVAFPFPILAIYLRFRCKTCKKRFADQGRDWQQEMQDAKSDQQSNQEALTQNDGSAPSGPSKVFLALGMLAFAGFIALEIQVGIQMNTKTQSLLKVTDRNGQIVAESVLNPMSDIFSFIDDILLVKIGAALAAQDFDMMRKVFVIGTGGGALCGIVGALIAVLVAFIPYTSKFLFNPFPSGSEDTCTWAQQDMDTTRHFFLLSSFAWPFQFANFAFSGFAMGTGPKGIPALGAVGLLQQLFMFVMIMVVFNADPRLEILGVARLGAAVLGTVSWGIFFGSQKDLRRKLGLVRQDEGARALTEGHGVRRAAAVRDFWADPETRQAMGEGLMAMVVELTVEMARTIALYVAARTMGIGAFYQLSAHVTLQVTTGLAMAEGSLFQMKLQGSQLLGSGLHQHFLWLIEYCLVYALIAVAICGAMVWTSTLSYVFEFGESACIFASSVACLPNYSGYFGGASQAADGEVSYPTTVLSVPVVVFIRVMYRFARSGLYALQDFQFMMRTGLICFIVFFLPAVVIMALTSRSALVAIAVMTVPNFTAMFAYGYRLKTHTDRLDSEDGARHNNVAMRRQETLRDQYGVDDAAPPISSQETELSWGRTGATDRAVALAAMPPPS